MHRRKVTMETRTYTCDCGCKQTINPDEAFVLGEKRSVSKRLSGRTNKAKLRDDLIFKDLNHLNRWTGKALSVLPGMIRNAEGLTPRGDIEHPDVEGLYV